MAETIKANINDKQTNGTGKDSVSFICLDRTIYEPIALY